MESFIKPPVRQARRILLATGFPSPLFLRFTFPFGIILENGTWTCSSIVLTGEHE